MTKPHQTRILAIALFLFPFVLQANTGYQPEQSSGTHFKEAVYGKKMMVVSANPFASQAGFTILKKGGNAIDAAIAMQMVLNIVEPQSSGLGGGAFLLYYRKKDAKVLAYDGRETAPQEIEEDCFLDADGKLTPYLKAIVGGKTVGVPGLLKMLEEVHSKEGKLPWQVLFEPAIERADRGFPISFRLNKLIKERENLSTFPDTKEYFFQENGEAKPEGRLLRNPQLAQTFRLIAQKGSAPFYKGEIAQEIVQTVRTASINPGKLSLADLENYSSIKREPIVTTYGDYLICGFPPPSGGGIAVAQILGMLQGHDLYRTRVNLRHLGGAKVPWLVILNGLGSLNQGGIVSCPNVARQPLFAITPYDLGSPEFIHLFCQASLLAFVDRNHHLADPDFSPVPVTKLLDSTYLQTKGKLIGKNRPLEKISPGVTSFEFPSTSHLCVVDEEGNMVSMTTSIEHAFGSGLMVRGFLLNSHLADFSFSPKINGKKVANRVEGGKRPMSSMAPTFVFHKKQPFLVIGSGGGPHIINYVARVLLGIFDFGLNIQEAINFPHYTAIKGTEINLEEGTFLQEKAPILQQMGHSIKVRPLTSSTHGIQISPAGLMSGVDPRREGTALAE